MYVYVDVAKDDLQLRLGQPFTVLSSSAAHPLHLLGDPVQEAWQGRERAVTKPRHAWPWPPQSPGRSSAVSGTWQSWIRPAPAPAPASGRRLAQCASWALASLLPPLFPCSSRRATQREHTGRRWGSEGGSIAESLQTIHAQSGLKTVSTIAEKSQLRPERDR